MRYKSILCVAVMALYVALASSFVSLAPWAQEQSDALRTTLEHVFTGDALGAFHSHAPTDCREKTFVYYLGVARQVLDKVKPQ